MKMIFKHLTIAAAIVFLLSLGQGQAFAQASSAPAAASTAPAAPDAAPAPATPDAGAPAAAPAAPAAASAAPAPAGESPYGLTHIWLTGTLVSKFILVVLAIMSAGTWYIFFVKFIDQTRILRHSKAVDKKFWTSATLRDGIDKLPKNSMFRALAESGVKASENGTSLVSMNDWIAMQLSHELEDATSKLQGGIAFLASVGSVAPFVGLFGTVWGILQALISIGVAGQASIDKVAGPVGEALIMTALGLAVAVPAVLLYNYLVRRNKVIVEKMRGFAGDLQSYLVTKK
jgi:biopolymer transport protein ExbB